MAKWAPCKRRVFIRKLVRLGFSPPEHPDFINFHKNSPLKNISQNPPLKIRGVRGVMKIIEITPFIPLNLRGRLRRRGRFRIWNLANEIATTRQVGARNDSTDGLLTRRGITIYCYWIEMFENGML